MWRRPDVLGGPAKGHVGERVDEQPILLEGQRVPAAAGLLAEQLVRLFLRVRSATGTPSGSKNSPVRWFPSSCVSRMVVTHAESPIPKVSFQMPERDTLLIFLGWVLVPLGSLLSLTGD